jgi:hypothetical protein
MLFKKIYILHYLKVNITLGKILCLQEKKVDLLWLNAEPWHS